MHGSMGERWKQAMDSWQQELGAGSEETSGMCACCLQVLCTAPALYPTRHSDRRSRGAAQALRSRRILQLKHQRQAR